MVRCKYSTGEAKGLLGFAGLRWVEPDNTCELEVRVDCSPHCGVAVRYLRSQRCECLAEVVQEVLGIFTANTHADEPFGNIIAASTPAPFCSGMDAAEARSFPDQFAAPKKALGLLTGFEAEGYDHTEVAHLSRSDFVCGVGRQPRIAHHRCLWP